MVTTLSSLITPQVAITTTDVANSDNKIGIMTTLICIQNYFSSFHTQNSS